jgi:hypothetical protein
MVYEAILQALEFLNSKCTENRGNNTRKKKTDQLSLRIQLVEGLFMKYATLYDVKYWVDIHQTTQCPV